MHIKFIASVILLSIFCLTTTEAQNTDIFIGTQTPVFYSLGIEQELFKSTSLNLQAGILTSPYDKTILTILKSFGTEEVIVNTIGDAFSHGLTFQLTPKIQFNKWYTGVYYSYLSLKAKDAPRDLIESYYGITIPDRIQTRNTELILTSNLNNIGILVGRKFNLKNPKLELRCELSVAKTFSSSSELSNSNDFVFENLSSRIDEELGQYYKDYGYIPSVNVFFVYKLVKTD